MLSTWGSFFDCGDSLYLALLYFFVLLHIVLVFFGTIISWIFSLAIFNLLQTSMPSLTFNSFSSRCKMHLLFLVLDFFFCFPASGNIWLKNGKCHFRNFEALSFYNHFFLRKQKFASEFFCPWHNVSTQKEHIFCSKSLISVFVKLMTSKLLFCFLIYSRVPNT